MRASCSSAATSYAWTGGTCAGTSGASCIVTPSADTTYSVTGGNAGGTGNTASATVTVVAQVTSPVCTLNATPPSIAAGGSATLTASCSPVAVTYAWSGGTCAGTSAASCIVTPKVTTTYTVAGISNAGTGNTASATVTVSTSTFSLTVAKSGAGSGTVTSPAGINCGATCSASLASGTKVALTATPASGSSFAGWSGACTGTGICAVTMDAAKTVTATFNIVPFVADTSTVITATSATITTKITVNPADLNKTGELFVTAWVPVTALGALGISVVANSELNVTSTLDDPNLAGAPSSLRLTQSTLAATDLAAFVLIELTSSGNWQLVVNGQLNSLASGVFQDFQHALTILKNADPTNIAGAQFCVGYGTSAAEMIAAGRLLLITVIPDPNPTSAATGTCLLTSMPVYRFFNNRAGGHFYTIDEAEKNTVIQNYNWFRYEGIGFGASTVPQPGTLPVYRFFNNNAGGHFYTINEAEKNTVIQSYNWFRYEGIGFYASPVQQPGTYPVYRFFNNNAGGHFYTMNEAEKNTVIQNYNWFRYEGIGFYAYPSL